MRRGKSKLGEKAEGDGAEVKGSWRASTKELRSKSLLEDQNLFITMRKGNIRTFRPLWKVSTLCPHVGEVLLPAQGPDGSGYRSPEMCHAWGEGSNVDIWGEQNDFRIHEREILCE